MSDKKKDEVLEKLDLITRVLALIATKDLNQQNSVEMLNRGRFKPAEIGHLLGLKTNIVTANLAQIKKKKQKKKQKKTRGKTTKKKTG